MKRAVKKRGSRHVSHVTRHGPAVIQVAAGLIIREGRYLIARRRAGTHLGGLWEFPGGKREEGESLTDCLRRELREELDVDVAAPVPFRVIRHEYPEKTVELHFFHCVISGGEARALDCEEFRWVMPEELTAYEFPPADRPLLAALKRHAGGRG
jgi:mutator protein MutT